MDPFPAEILAEVDVERAHTAVLFHIAATQNTLQKPNPNASHWHKQLHKRPPSWYLESFLVIVRGGLIDGTLGSSARSCIGYNSFLLKTLVPRTYQADVDDE